MELETWTQAIEDLAFPFKSHFLKSYRQSSGFWGALFFREIPILETWLKMGLSENVGLIFPIIAI